MTVSLVNGHIDEPINNIKCPCSLRQYMELEDCDKTDCEQCCPLVEKKTLKEILNEVRNLW